MRCSACGTDSPPTARFCAECGAHLATACPQCGVEVGPTARFCQECGARLAPAPASDATTVAPPPQTYTPRHLAEKILAGRDALEGERKQVTVLFADIKGSTELIQGLDTEPAQRLLDGAVRVMMDAVHRFEGTVSRLMGDGIMALFGAPVAHEDHAVRACYAALTLQAGIHTHAEAAFAEHGLSVEARVGLNSGEVIVRLVSDDLHMDYTAMGQTVHLASRMEGLARAGSSLMTADTLRLVEGYVQVRSRGRAPVKGLAEPVEVFELEGAGAARTRLQAASARGLTRFVGRDAEVAALYAALARAEAGHGQVAALVGEPGVGKSRLVWEVTHSHRTEGWTILEAGSVSYGKATSYLPVIDLLRAYCRIEARDDPRTVREKVTGKLLALDRALEPTLPALLALLDVPIEDADWGALDPRQRRRRTLDAARRLLLRESREQPLLLVFEDLHWIDAETQALLDGLVEGVPTARVLLLVNYRPEYAHTWGSKTYYTQLRVDPLPPDGAEDLLAALVGEDASLRDLKALLIEGTEGNPFFLEESVRSLVETEALVGERGSHRLIAPGVEVRVPATVQAVLAARIDRLPPDDKRLLQTAAVVGKDVPYAVLAAMAGPSDDDLRAGLGRLQAAEFLYEASLFPEPQYTFKHALTHEVAYGGLLGDRLKALHARIVDAIEAVYADRLDEQTELLAHHALRGEAWTKASHYAHRAGDRAAARSVNRAATTYFEQALAALARLPESRPLQERAIDLRIQLRQALAGTGRDEDALAYLREAESIAGAIGDRHRQARIAAQVSFCLSVMGDYAGAAEVGRGALEAAEAVGDLPVRIVARHRLGQIDWHTGQYRRAVANLRQAIAAIPDALVAERFDMGAAPSVEARLILGDCLAKLDGLAEPRTLWREALGIAESLDHPYTLMIACLAIGYSYVEGGSLVEALPMLERAHALTVGLDVPTYLLVSASALGLAYALMGRAAEAVPLVERAERIDRSARPRADSGRFAVMRGEAYLALGRGDEALEQTERAMASVTERGERGTEASARWLLAEIARVCEPRDAQAAEARYHEAFAIAEALGMRPLQARCHLGLGKLYCRVGRPDEARDELTTAVAMLREMGMTFWLPEAEAELGKLAKVAR